MESLLERERNWPVGAFLPHYLNVSGSPTLCCCAAGRAAHVTVRRHRVEHHGLFGSIWASFGMTAYYMAITWINILLGLFLGPLFVIPLTWIQDAMNKK
jgi:hypothetical protein